MWPFKSRKEILRELKEELRIEAEEEALREEEKRKKLEAEVAKKFEEEKRIKEEKERELKNSEKPWFVLTAAIAEDDPKKGLETSMDWNEGFVEYFKTHGFTGADDNQIVYNGMLVMTRALMEQMQVEMEVESEHE